jgi:DNA-binding transcriptional ArsR family regulator
VENSLRAIAEPRRQEILRLIAERELASGEIASHFDISRPAISQHLQVLKAAGLITERRAGTRRLYQARPEGLAHLRDFLDQFWAGGLERLARAAAAEQRRQDVGDERR